MSKARGIGVRRYRRAELGCGGEASPGAPARPHPYGYQYARRLRHRRGDRDEKRPQDQEYPDRIPHEHERAVAQPLRRQPGHQPGIRHGRVFGEDRRPGRARGQDPGDPRETMREFSVSSLPEFDNHELVAFFEDKKTGLKSFVAVHNTNLGPATGGTRYWNYRSEREALRDALRLSQAMTYKCALARVPHGGGKGVIMANSHHPRKRRFLTAYAKRINLFNGSFTTGEDVGINVDDIKLMLRHSPFVNGKPNIAGDLSPWAALGVFSAMQGALESMYGSADFEGRTVAIKGIGKLGAELCVLLHKQGARI